MAELATTTSLLLQWYPSALRLVPFSPSCRACSTNPGLHAMSRPMAPSPLLCLMLAVSNGDSFFLGLCFVQGTRVTGSCSSEMHAPLTARYRSRLRSAGSNTEICKSPLAASQRLASRSGRRDMIVATMGQPRVILESTTQLAGGSSGAQPSQTLLIALMERRSKAPPQG